MALRDRLARPVAVAVPAVPAVFGASEGARTAKTAKTAAIRQPDGYPSQEAEIRRFLAHEMRGAGADHPDYAEALAIALADPGAALDAVEAWKREGSQ